MKVLSDIINSILSFKSYVMLPILMLILSLFIGIKIKKALKACITLGIGFIGIFIVFDYFVSKIGPVLKSILQRTGISLNVLDVGWPPLAGMAWSFKFAPILIIIIMVINIIMLMLKLTSTVNIDIWNYWHFIFTGQLVYFITGNIVLSFASVIFIMIICVKLGDWSAKDVEKISGMPGVAITTLSGVAFYPFAVVMDKLFDRIPALNEIKADPESIKNKLGFFGEPMFIGFAMGIALSVAAGYAFKDVLELAFNISAVVYILPKMTGILSEGLIPISEGMKEYMIKKFPEIKNSYIGLDQAIIVGNPAAIVTGILLMPTALILAFILPGIRFIPLGDLPNTIGLVTVIVVATKGNVIRSFLVGIPIIIANLYAASGMADIYTSLASKTGYHVSGYDGVITSFLDGGNAMRVWVVRLFTGSMWAIAIVPIVAYLFYFTYKTKIKNVI